MAAAPLQSVVDPLGATAKSITRNVTEVTRSATSALVGTLQGRRSSTGAERPEGKLTEHQIGELRACFDTFDVDGSGSLCVPHRCIPADRSISSSGARAPFLWRASRCLSLSLSLFLALSLSTLFLTLSLSPSLSLCTGTRTRSAVR